MLSRSSVLALLVSLSPSLLVAQGPPGVGAVSRPAKVVVADIRRADYEGDRAALRDLVLSFGALPADSKVAARVLYWKGFALWRRAVNGFNAANANPEDLERDLLRAQAYFDDAGRRDPEFHDAAIGRFSCAGLIGFVNRSDASRLQAVVAQMQPLAVSLRSVAADNPRWIWVLGQNQWVAPPGTPTEVVEARRARVLSEYIRGLDLARQQQRAATDPLEPVWGEPELLMSLAWSMLNQTQPDLASAERHARAALAIVPNWHYVRDILLPQILRKKGA